MLDVYILYKLYTSIYIQIDTIRTNIKINIIYIYVCVFIYTS